MYCCEDTGSMKALGPIEKEKLVYVNMSIADAQWIARKLETVRKDSDNGNGEIHVVLVGKTIKKIKTICDEFCENIADSFSRKRHIR